MQAASQRVRRWSLPPQTRSVDLDQNRVSRGARDSWRRDRVRLARAQPARHQGPWHFTPTALTGASWPAIGLTSSAEMLTLRIDEHRQRIGLAGEIRHRLAGFDQHRAERAVEA